MESPPTGTVTFLFTDIEGSTRRWQDEPEAMRALLVEHDAILRDVIDKRHGHLFKHTGDGVAAVFASAADAVSAAVDAQARLHAVLPVRMGLHTGEAELRDGDYFGSTLNRCARLMGVAHGGQIVCSAVTAELVRDRDDLRDLGEHRLRDLSRAERVWQVGGGEFPALRSMENHATNLPLQSSSFVGRAREVDSVVKLLADDRLVTLTGVGGVGKTRLALAVGAEVLPRLADGVWVVELAPIAHEDMVLATLGEVLGIAPQAGEPLATTLVNRLRTKQILVIIDNCEHVLGPVARFVDRLTTSAPGVRVLATSREPLGINAERVRAVPPLAEGTEAVELFIDRATHAGAAFDDREHQAIRDICVRLDGIPLAIELAAARARMMTPTQIAERLDQRFRLLTGGGRTAVERHRTLQAAVSWSYDLLDDVERSVFQRLSTLAGSFDLLSAEAIAAGGQVEGFEVLDAVGHLVDKSMLFTVATPMGGRYRLLETLRQYAADRLAEQPDAAEVEDRHAAYWCDRAVSMGRATRGADHSAVLDAVDADIDNHRAAFAHLLSSGRPNAAARGILALGTYWVLRRNREGLRWYLQLLAHGDLEPNTRLRALANAARVEAQGDVLAAERYAAEAIHGAAAAGVDPPWGALYALLWVAHHRNDPDGIRRWYDRAYRIALASGQRQIRLTTACMRGAVPTAWPSAELIEHYERLDAEVHRYGDQLLVVSSSYLFVGVLHEAGEIERAGAVAHAGVHAARGTGPLTLGQTLVIAAAIDALRGDAQAARQAIEECLPIARDEGLALYTICAAFVAAALAARRDDAESAAMLLAAAAHHSDSLGVVGSSLFLACAAQARRVVDAHRGDLTAARRHGAAMSLDDLNAYALDTLN